MGKRRKLIGLGLMLAMLCSSPAMADLDPAEETQQSAAQAQQVQPAPPQETQSQPSMNLDGEQRIEQVYLNLPEVFVYGEGFSADEVAAGEGYLSQDKLEFVRAVPFHEMGEGITYYVLLDISGSIPRSYFA